MKIVLAPDSFKECISATDACQSMAQVIDAYPNCHSISRPMADGGEGTGHLLADSLNLIRVSLDVRDPLGRTVPAGFYVSKDGKIAVVETAEANGLGLLRKSERSPERADSGGCGQLIQAALTTVTDTVFVAVGGSATVDGGKGMADALGYRFLDDHGRSLASGAGSLRDLARIEPPAKPCSQTNTVVLCDVTNPLLGPCGAAPVFAPQKGADPAMVRRLEAGLTRLATCIHRDLSVDVRQLSGGGAAGGMGAGLAAFARGRLTSGADTVAECIGLEKALIGADLVIAGEGKVDGQSFDGKVLSTVARLARKQGVPVCVIGGIIQCDASVLRSNGVSLQYQLMKPGEGVKESMTHVRERLAQAAIDACHAINNAR